MNKAKCIHGNEFIVNEQFIYLNGSSVTIFARELLYIYNRTLRVHSRRIKIMDRKNVSKRLHSEQREQFQAVGSCDFAMSAQKYPQQKYEHLNLLVYVRVRARLYFYHVQVMYFGIIFFIHFFFLVELLIFQLMLVWLWLFLLYRLLIGNDVLFAHRFLVVSGCILYLYLIVFPGIKKMILIRFRSGYALCYCILSYKATKCVCTLY